MDELVRVLKSDDELVRLNNEARDLGRHAQDETAAQQMRQEVARLLRLQVSMSPKRSAESRLVMVGHLSHRPTRVRRPFATADRTS